MCMTCSSSLSGEVSLRYEQKLNTKSYLLSALWAPLDSSNLLIIPLLSAYKVSLPESHMNPFTTSHRPLLHCHIFRETLVDQVLLT